MTQIWKGKQKSSFRPRYEYSDCTYESIFKTRGNYEEVDKTDAKNEKNYLFSL